MSDLEFLVIPDNVISIGAYAFYQCFPESVTFGTGVQVIGEYAFENCSSIKSIDLPAGLTTIGRDAFANCDGMTSLTIPSSVTSIGAYAFSNCVGLEQVTVQWATPFSIDEVLRFSGVNTRFVRLNVPEGTEEDYFGATEWKDFYIEGLSPFPGGECGINLTWTYDMNGTLTVAGYGPMPNWYYDYGTATNPWDFLSGNIHTVILPEGLTYIGDYAFSNFEELSSLTIPAGVASIGDRVFGNYSPKVRTITCLRPTPPSVSSRTFNGLSNVANVKLLVPAGSADLYRATAVWQDFMIEESTGIETSAANDPIVATRYYDLQGKEVVSPQAGQVYIAKELHRSGQTTARKVVK